MDDNEEAVVKRIKVFNEQSLPVIKYYEKLNFVKQIDSGQTPEEVFDDVKKYLQWIHKLVNIFVG